MFNWLRRHTAPSPPDGRVVRTVVNGSDRIQLDLTPQVLELRMEEATTFDVGEPRLLRTCPDTSGFVSASMLAVRAKLFDDGLYAAAELTAQPGKARLLAALAGASPWVEAAAHLGGANVGVSAEARTVTDEFLDHEHESKPLGFYTWSAALRRIFQQDRLLQQELPAADARALASAIDSDPAMAAWYSAYLECVARLTNPPASGMPDLRHPAGRHFFPPSRSHESDLIARLYGETPIPDGVSLADEMVSRLMDDRLRLDPTDESGWYDLQTWALEPLVRLDRTPEGRRLQTNEEYRKQLRDLFKAVLALTRETHVKQVQHPPCGAAGGGAPRRIVWIWPSLTVEPTRTYYERRAQGYEFVRDVLSSLGPLEEMRRQTADGPAPRPLDEELAEMIELFRGAAAVAGHELGMAPASDVERARFAALASSAGVSDDVRMMVPVFYDEERRQTKVWALLGWTTRDLSLGFVTPPSVEVLAGDAEITFGWSFRKLALPVFAEAYVTSVMDRNEFRAHCDTHRTRGNILANLR